MRWLIKDPAKASISLHRHLLAATPTWKDDFMRDAMKVCKKRDPGNYLAIALYDGENLIGWAMLDFYLSTDRSVKTYIYVRTRYRRRGFGTKIIEKAKKIIEAMGKDIRVLPHDRRSKRFYKSLRVSKRQVVYGYTLE